MGVLASACATAIGEKEIKSKLDTLKKRQSEIDSVTEKRFGEITLTQKKLSEIIEIALKNEADIKHDMERLNSGIERLGAIKEEGEYDFGVLMENIGALDKRISQLQFMLMEGNLKQSRKVESFRSDTSEVYATIYAELEKIQKLLFKAKPGDRKIRKLKKSAVKKTKPAESGMPAERLYSDAYKNFLSGNYAQAGVYFAEYVKRYPDSEFSDNSQYWLGESLISQGKTDDAVDAFIAVAKKYPTSTKAPTALLRAAVLLEKQGRKKNAREILVEIKKNYPASKESSEAEEKLDAQKTKKRKG